MPRHSDPVFGNIGFPVTGLSRACSSCPPSSKPIAHHDGWVNGWVNEQTGIVWTKLAHSVLNILLIWIFLRNTRLQGFVHYKHCISPTWSFLLSLSLTPPATSSQVIQSVATHPQTHEHSELQLFWLHSNHGPIFPKKSDSEMRPFWTPSPLPRSHKPRTSCDLTEEILG